MYYIMLVMNYNDDLDPIQKNQDPSKYSQLISIQVFWNLQFNLSIQKCNSIDW
jgi:hypothetical protein